MTNQCPVDYIDRAIDCATREVLEGRCAEVIRWLSSWSGRRNDADCRIRVEAPDDRILEGGRHLSIEGMCNRNVTDCRGMLCFSVR